MFCYGYRHIFFAAYLIYMCVQLSSSHLRRLHVRQNEQLNDINGNLYDIFKERLTKFGDQLSFNYTDNLLKNKSVLELATNLQNEVSYEDPSLGNQMNKNYGLFPKFGNVLKRKTDRNENSEENQSSITASLYEVYKNSLDRTNEQLALFDGKVTDQNTQQSKLQSSFSNTLLKRQNSRSKRDLYDIYKKQIGNLNDSWNKRNDRSVLKVVDDNLCRTQSIENVKPYPISNENYNFYYYNKKPRRRTINNDQYKFAYNSDIHKSNQSVRRRKALKLDNRAADDASTYPAVLTKALESSLNPLTNITPKSLLETVAQKMNTTTLDLAKKLTTMNDVNTVSLQNDSKLNHMLDKYIENAVLLKTTMDKSKKHIDTSNCCNQSVRTTACQPNDPPPAQQNTQKLCDNYETQKITGILDKVLLKLEELQELHLCAANASEQAPEGGNEPEDEEGECQPEGSPCDIVGSWNSLDIGLRFDISLAKIEERQLSSTEMDNKLLTIAVQEINPPKKHYVMDIDWSFMGSAMKQLGGPFYMYTQKRLDNTIAFFAGYCRTCGDTDTIFGSWTFLYPSKDCVDIMTSIEHRADILRRFTLDEKREERFKQILYLRNKKRMRKSASSRRTDQKK